MSRRAVVKRGKIRRCREDGATWISTAFGRVHSLASAIKSGSVFIRKTEWPAFDEYVTELQSTPRASFDREFLQECSPPSEAYLAGERAYASGLQSDVPQWVRQADAVWEYRQGYSRAAARDYSPRQREKERGR